MAGLAPDESRIATYRLQVTPSFGFDAAREVLDHVRRLGVSHLYLSPCLQAADGSEHGYDVTDPTRIDAARGGEAAFTRLLEAARDHGLRVLLDIVPNHMAATEQGPWWRDVLANGRRSRYAEYFDIDWDAPPPAPHGRVLLPILGDRVAQEIAAGHIRVVAAADGTPELAVYDRRLPLCPEMLDARPEQLDVARVLTAQHYELAFWRDGLQRLNWRRFFDVDTLVGVRVEEPAVFEATHRKVLDFVDAGLVHGLRVDHPDGLRDPAGYFADLRAAAPRAWLLAEKILEGDERLPADWPIDGTTGYDFMSRSTALFVAPSAESALTALCTELTGDCPPFGELQRAKRREVLPQLFVPELRGVTRWFGEVAAAVGLRVDPQVLQQVLVEVLVEFPVYRTYVRERGVADARDAQHLRTAFTGAAAALGAGDAQSSADLLHRVLRGDEHAGPAAELRARFQQLSGPVIAKGVEDTALYCDRRLAALAEVGADPGHFGVTPEEFHAFCAELAGAWPSTLLATSTHDTKRSEDVRMRIAALSEMPVAWADEVRNWRAHNEQHRAAGLPDRGTEYLLYQTLVGVWPASVARITAKSLKAAREAKEHTSWIDGEPDVEAALQDFVTAILTDADFVARLDAFVPQVLPIARIHSLAQTLLKITAPGVPDFYQGCEHWRESMVDPDNRRAVDFARLRVLAAAANDRAPEDVLGASDGGLAKLWLVHRALAARARHAAAFAPGSAYTPLAVRGAGAEHAVAFARGDAVVSVVPRLVGSRPPGAERSHVELPPGRWRDALTGAPFDAAPATLAALFARFPVALLERDGGA